MIYLKISLLSLFLFVSGLVWAQGSEHGGRNGGDGQEIEIELMAHKIASFVNSNQGREAFPEVNAEYLKSIVSQTSFAVVTGPITDKYGVTRTCTNDPRTLDIICDTDRLALIKDPGVYYVIIFHEILGLMNLELGYSQDVSMYPISKRMVSYIEDIKNIDTSSTSQRKEYHSLKNKSRGIEAVSKKTKEKIRLICLDSVEIHKCQSFSYVRTLNDKQAPLVADVSALSPNDLEKIHGVLQSFKRKANVNKYESSIVDRAQEVNNFKGSMAFAGKEVTLNKDDFNNLENLLIFTLKSLKK